MKPHSDITPFELNELVQSLRMAFLNFTPEGSADWLCFRSYTLREAGALISFSEKYMRAHLSEFPGAFRAPGGALRIPAKDLKKAMERWRLRRPQPQAQEEAA